MRALRLYRQPTTTAPNAVIGPRPGPIQEVRVRPVHHRQLVRTVRRSVTGVVVVGLIALVVVMVVQHRRDTDRFDTAHRAYLAGDCTAAITEYDTLLGSSRLFDTARVEHRATTERTECTTLLAIDRVAELDPATGIEQFAAFVESHAGSPLNDIVDDHVAAVVQRDDASKIATEHNCDRFEAYRVLGLFAANDVPPVQLWCAQTYAGAGRDADAYALAVAILGAPAGGEVLTGAVAVALRSRAACTDVDRLMELGGLDQRADELAGFLEGCMSAAWADGDIPGLTDLQITFLAVLPLHADTPTIEAALIGNPSACDHLDELQADATIAARPGFMPTLMLACAQTAEGMQDYQAAIERFQWFVDNYPLDPRLTAAQEGLARSLIADARQRGAGELPPPTPTGRSGSDLVSVVIFNDSPNELRIVLSGPESRIVNVAPSPTSSTYPVVGPLTCRTDVPTIELSVKPGDYQVLVDAIDGTVRPYAGAWSLGSGATYESCFFIVTSFG